MHPLGQWRRSLKVLGSLDHPLWISGAVDVLAVNNDMIEAVLPSIWEFWDRVGASQISQVARLAGSVASCWYALCVAVGLMICWDSNSTKQIRSLNDRCCQTHDDVPFDMAMKEPDTGIVCLEADDCITVRVHCKRVAFHWHRGEVSALAGVLSFATGGSLNYLELMPMQVERVDSSIQVVDCDLNDVSSVYNERIDCPVYDWVGV